MNSLIGLSPLKDRSAVLTVGENGSSLTFWMQYPLWVKRYSFFAAKPDAKSALTQKPT
jgi:hypothetical protein